MLRVTFCGQSSQTCLLGAHPREITNISVKGKLMPSSASFLVQAARCIQTQPMTTYSLRYWARQSHCSHLTSLPPVLDALKICHRLQAAAHSISQADDVGRVSPAATDSLLSDYCTMPAHNRVYMKRLPHQHSHTHLRRAVIISMDDTQQQSVEITISCSHTSSAIQLRLCKSATTIWHTFILCVSRAQVLLIT